MLNRPGADARRDRLLMPFAPGVGFDRDEYPPERWVAAAAMGQRGLAAGTNPIGWMADVMYVQGSEHRSHGSSLGALLRGLCNGARFRYVVCAP